ncbi:YchJ family metal-binding protein [Paraglaciecola sp. Hal342]
MLPTILAQGLSTPSTPEQLMRSRYSAYAFGHFQYVLDTYTQSQRQTLTLDDLIQSSSETQWLRLDVLDALVIKTCSTGQVEFIAYDIALTMKCIKCMSVRPSILKIIFGVTIAVRYSKTVEFIDPSEMIYVYGQW